MSLTRHSGARQRREPGTHEHGLASDGREPVVMDSRLRGNDDVGTKGARVCMGVVGAPHGVRGAVRIKSFTDVPEAIARYGALEDESGARRFELRVAGT